jgi:hypothetical protein
MVTGVQTCALPIYAVTTGDFLVLGSDGEPIWDDDRNWIWAYGPDGEEFTEAASFYDGVLVSEDGTVLAGSDDGGDRAILVSGDSILLGSERVWLIGDAYGLLRNNSYNLLTI